MIDLQEGLLWVVVEECDAGRTTVGVFTSLAAARAVVDELAGDRLEAYRIEGHALDQPRMEPIPWQVELTRNGAIARATPFIGCACSDDEAEYYKHSFIEQGGASMHVIAFAVTPGQAIEVCREYHTWLQENGHWDGERVALSPVQARTRVDPVSSAGGQV